MENQQLIKKDETKQEYYRNVMCVLLTELLFIFLPLVVLLIVSTLATNEFVKIFSKTEWAFVTAILFGQSIVKLVGGLLSSHENVHWPRPVLVIAGIIVIGLVPSLIIMTLIAISPEPSLSLIFTQLVLFIFSVICFIVFGGVGQSYFMKSEKK